MRFDDLLDVAPAVAQLAEACDTIRVEILCHLSAGPSRVNDIAASLELEPNHVSYHLGALRERRLVKFSRRSTERVYSLTELVRAIPQGKRLVLRLEGAAGCALCIEIPIEHTKTGTG